MDKEKKLQKKREYMRNRRAAHPEKERERSREYCAKNKEKVREQNREATRRYREAHRERLKTWRTENQEQIKKYRVTYRVANKEKLRAYQLKRDYGLTPEAYNTRLDGQGFVCCICFAPDFSEGQPLHVDHKHDSGQVRGLLCRECNHGVGKFKDNPALLRRAANYLDYHDRAARLEQEEEK